MATDDDSITNHISIPPVVFYLMLGGATLGGGGLMGVIGPTLEKEAVSACLDNSQIALDVAAQHGHEIQALRELIYERTQDRYTSSDARSDWAEQYRRDDQQDRRTALIERQLEGKQE